jgi:uncharacterized protein
MNPGYLGRGIHRAAALIAIALLASSAVPHAQAPVPSPAVDEASTLIEVRALVQQLVSGETARVVDRFTDQMKASVSEAQLKQGLAALAIQTGAFKSQVAARFEPKGALRQVVVTNQYERSALDFTVVLDAANRIAGLAIRPYAPPANYAVPPYVDAATFTSQDVTVDAGGWPLPGTLSMPAGTGPVPAVVLVHGSGPQDRDETLGSLKPLRDLAEGLASRGVAVLRYDKRTRQHPTRLTRAMTVNDEVVDDALAAVALLRATPRVRADRIFVLGHSLGGTMAPRIASRDPRVAGLVIIAGLVRPLEQAVVDQVRYIALLDGTVQPAEQQQIDGYVALGAQIAKLTEADVATGPAVMGAPPAYWLDIRSYRPLEVAAKLAQPMFILQGERDYQVTMTDDFAAWRRALEGRPNVTLKSYPGLNHMMMAGTGPSTPNEYNTAANVAEVVVTDITAWVKRQ